MSVLGGLALVGLGLVAILVIILALPWRLEAMATSAPAAKAELRLRLFAPWMPAFVLYRSDAPAKPKKPDRPRKPKRKSKSRGRSDGARLARHLPRLVLRLLSLFDVRRLEGRLRFGFGDPAETGMAFGRLTAILRSLPPGRRIDLSLEPDFGAAVLEAEGRAIVVVTPIRIVGPIAQFAWASFGPARGAKPA